MFAARPREDMFNQHQLSHGFHEQFTFKMQMNVWVWIPRTFDNQTYGLPEALMALKSFPTPGSTRLSITSRAVAPFSTPPAPAGIQKSRVELDQEALSLRALLFWLGEAI